VRSTDLLSLPNINPDAGFGMQMSIEDSLTENSVACFQAALGLMLGSDNKSVDRTKKFPWKVWMLNPV
jgi:hypothetical protein